MNKDSLIHLTFAVHKVANLLPEPMLGQELKASANRLLSDLLLVADENPVTPEQKRGVVPRAIRETGGLRAYFGYAKRMNWVNPVNFLILEKEYQKIENLLRDFHQKTGMQQRSQPAPSVLGPQARFVEPKTFDWVKGQKGENQATLNPVKDSKKTDISERQKKILALLQNKDKVQVWELLKVFPQVTKRTLRRDMDDLLKKNLISRGGEWNAVFYQLS